jgi:hypothetical protein
MNQISQALIDLGLTGGNPHSQMQDDVEKRRKAKLGAGDVTPPNGTDFMNSLAAMELFGGNRRG